MKPAKLKEIHCDCRRCGVCCLGMSSVLAQEKQYPKQAYLPNPYRLEENCPTLPANMNGGHWGEPHSLPTSIPRATSIWVFHRCFNAEPAGYATCVGRREPPILEFDPSGKLLTSFGSGMFAGVSPRIHRGPARKYLGQRCQQRRKTVLGISAKDAGAWSAGTRYSK